MPYNNSYKFQPKKPVRSFRDLDVYQKNLECSVIIVKDIAPALARFGQEAKKGPSRGRQAQGAGQSRDCEVKYPFLENLVNCSMTIPLLVAEAHSLRFASLEQGVKLLEQAMAAVNKMVVYLEQARGMYGAKLDSDLVEDIIGRYIGIRGKMFRLEKAWKKFSEDREPPPRPVRY